MKSCYICGGGGEEGDWGIQCSLNPAKRSKLVFTFKFLSEVRCLKFLFFIIVYFNIHTVQTTLSLSIFTLSRKLESYCIVSTKYCNHWIKFLILIEFTTANTYSWFQHRSANCQTSYAISRVSENALFKILVLWLFFSKNSIDSGGI